MQKRKAKRVTRELSLEEKQRLDRARKKSDRDRMKIKELARKAKAEHDAVITQIIHALREERDAQGMSLTDVKEKSGFSRSALCRLENDLSPNPRSPR